MEEKTKHSETNTPGTEEHKFRYKSKQTHTSKEEHKDDEDQEDTTSRIKPFINMYDPFG